MILYLNFKFTPFSTPGRFHIKAVLQKSLTQTFLSLALLQENWPKAPVDYLKEATCFWISSNAIDSSVQTTIALSWFIGTSSRAVHWGVPGTHTKHLLFFVPAVTISRVARATAVTQGTPNFLKQNKNLTKLQGRGGVQYQQQSFLALHGCHKELAAGAGRKGPERAAV